MATKLFDPTIVGDAQEAVNFITNILESSTEYSVIGKDLDGKILLWNEGARRLYGYEPEEVVGRANSEILHTPEDVKAGKPREILAAGCDAYIVKPIDTRDLPRKVAETRSRGPD